MNGPTHKFAGAFTALAVTQLDSEGKTSAVHNPIIAIALGGYLGRLPDMIEPSVGNPNHRQFFHSLALLGVVATGVYKAYRWEPKDNLEKIIRGIALIGGTAYLSHLALDSLTSKSLPLIGKL